MAILTGWKLWFCVILYIVTLVIAITFIVLYTTQSNTSTPQPASVSSTESIGTNQMERLQLRAATASKNAIIGCNPFENIDKIYYINMDKRKDRKYEIESELKSLNVPWHKVQRIPGVISTIGALGCSKAHLNALKDCRDNNYSNCLILEDDFMFKQERQEIFNQLNKFWNLNIVWDVVLFSSNTIQQEATYVDFLLRLKEAQTTAGYMVNANFLPQLIENVEKGIALLESDNNNMSFCIDQYWKLLQPNNNWFTFFPVMAHQRDGYSDIEKKTVSYADKNEIAVQQRPVHYIISVLSCVPRLKKSKKEIEALDILLKNHNIQYFFYYGNSNLPQDFELNLNESTVCVKDRDDYLNLSHKIGQMMSFLRSYVTLNMKCTDIKGFLFIDDDLDIYTDNFLNFLDSRSTIPYWGNTATHKEDYSDHLKTKNEQSSIIQKTLLAYPELLSYPIKVKNNVEYCSGGCFYLSYSTLNMLSSLTGPFKPFPEDATELSYHKKVDDTGKTYFDNLCVFNDLDIAVALKSIGITPLYAPIKEIVYWEGL